jgi:hypothetical protein
MRQQRRLTIITWARGSTATAGGNADSDAAEQAKILAD